MGKQLSLSSSVLQISTLWQMGTYTSAPCCLQCWQLSLLIQHPNTLSKKIKVGNANGKARQSCQSQIFECQKSGHRKMWDLFKYICLNIFVAFCLLPPVIWHNTLKMKYRLHANSITRWCTCTGIPTERLGRWDLPIIIFVKMSEFPSKKLGGSHCSSFASADLEGNSLLMSECHPTE